MNEPFSKSFMNEQLLVKQRNLLKIEDRIDCLIEPYHQFSCAGNLTNNELGKKLIARGQVGCLMVAGGQGSRLKFDGPKGMFPLTPLTKKSLFQLFAERLLALKGQTKCALKAAIMTAPDNHEQTLEFFKNNRYFGLDADQLSFFMQSTLPLLDSDGHFILDSCGQMIMAPDGNGRALHAFYESGIWNKWQSAGICYVNFVPVDNPLADPFDAELIGYHENCQSDVVIKCVERTDPEEKVGIVVQQNHKKVIIEYSEMPLLSKTKKDPNGHLLHRCANTSLFSFKMDFISSLQKTQLEMPLHKAYKNLPGYLDVYAWKFETFIFDVLLATNHVDVLMYLRSDCFCPLKDQKSIRYVQDALKIRFGIE